MQNTMKKWRMKAKLNNPYQRFYTIEEFVNLLNVRALSALTF
jgi:hypothetical protein